MSSAKTLLAVLCCLALLGACTKDPGNGNNANDNANDNGNNQNNNNAPGICGDGTIDIGEECDDGSANSDSLPDACRSGCADPWCGDLVMDSGEACDDGNLVEEDPCLTTCVANACGDGYLNPGVEECDDGSDNSDIRADACRTDCVLPRCGDGVFDPIAGEECDDGNLSDTDGCENTCVLNEGFLLYSGGFPAFGGSHIMVGGHDNGSYLIAYAKSVNALGILKVDNIGDWEAGADIPGFDDNGYPAMASAGDHYVLALAHPSALPANRDIDVSDLDASGVPTSTSTKNFPIAVLQGLATRGGVDPYIYAQGPINNELHLNLIGGSADTVGNTGALPTTGVASIGAAADGFLVAWRNGDNIRGHWVSAAGVLDASGVFMIYDGSTLPATSRPRLAMLSDGTTLVVWAQNNGSLEIAGRLYLPTRAAAGASFTINTSGASSRRPDVVATYDDEFAVGWVRDLASDFDIVTRVVLPDGSMPALPFTVYQQAGGASSGRLRMGASSSGVLLAWEVGNSIRASVIPRPAP